MRKPLRRFCLSISAVLYFWSQAVPCAASGQRTEDLIARANRQENLWIADTPPTQIHAEIDLSEKGKTVRGDYIFDWISTNRWREEIHFANCERIRVGAEGGYWQKATVDYQPEFVFTLDELLRLRDTLRVGPSQTLGKPKARELNGAKQDCADVKWPSSVERTLCFDSGNGTLVSVEYPTGELQHPAYVSRIEFGPFTNVFGKLIPFGARAFHGTDVISSVKVQNISGAPQSDARLFDQPQGAEFWAQCDGMRLPELVDAPEPPYPPDAKARRDQGRIVVYAVVETDGSLSHVTLIHGGPSALEIAGPKTIQHWRYKPAACAGKPVRMEISTSLDYFLQ